jgi:predicted PurR-regulated permease PerM
VDREYSVVVSARGFAIIGCFVLATLAGVLVVDRASQVFVLLGAATTAAVIAVPFVQSLGRWLPRGAAIVIVTLIGMFGTVAVLGAVAWDLNRQASALSDSLHSAVADLPPDSAAARTASDLEVDRRIDSVFDTAATRLVVGETDPVAVAGQVAKVVVVGVLAAFIVAGGRQLTDLLIRFARRTSIRAELHASLSMAVARSGVLRRMITVSVMRPCGCFDRAPSACRAGLDRCMGDHRVDGADPRWCLGVAAGCRLASAHDIPIVVGDRSRSCASSPTAWRARWAHHPLRVGPLVALIGIGAGFKLIGVSGAILGLFVAAFVSAMLSQQGHLVAAVTDLIEDPDDRTVPVAETVGSVEEHVFAEPRDDETYVRLRPSGELVTAALASPVP